MLFDLLTRSVGRIVYNEKNNSKTLKIWEDKYGAHA